MPTDGGASLAFIPSPASQPPWTGNSARVSAQVFPAHTLSDGKGNPVRKQLTVVRAIHVDLYEGLTAPPPPDVALLLPGSSGVEQHDGGEGVYG